MLRRNLSQMNLTNNKMDGLIMKQQQIRLLTQLPIANAAANAGLFSLLRPLGVNSKGCGSCGK